MLRAEIANHFVAMEPPRHILYGGSVKPVNVKKKFDGARKSTWHALVRGIKLFSFPLFARHRQLFSAHCLCSGERS